MGLHMNRTLNDIGRRVLWQGVVFVSVLHLHLM
jgi:hypothetical protein